MANVTPKLIKKKDATTQWQIQVRNFTTNHKVKVNLCLPELSVTNILTWECHVDNFTDFRFSMILGRYLLTAPGLDLNIFKQVISVGEGTYKGFMASMVDLSAYDYIYLTLEDHVKLEESFMDAYVEDFLNWKMYVHPEKYYT